MANTFENEYVCYEMSDDIIYMRSKSNMVLDKTTAIVMTADRIRLQFGSVFSVFFDMTGMIDSDKEGRDYLAKHGWLLTRIVSICAEDYCASTIATFYLFVNKPIVNTKVFSTEKDAFAFLETHSK